MVKYNGTETEPIPSNQVKQIAGRAGRYGTLHEAGLLTTYTHEMCHVLLFRVNSLHSKDMKYLKRCISIPNTPIPGAGLLPTADHIVNLSHLIRGVSLPEIIVHPIWLWGSALLFIADIPRSCPVGQKVFPLSLQRPPENG